MRQAVRCWLLFLVLLTLPACGVHRTITVVTDPPGALVWINDREMGRSPVETAFVHYGTYDVRLELEGFEPVSTSGKADAPWWDTPGADFFAETLPGDRHARIVWRYTLQPANDDPDALVLRARALRSRIEEEQQQEQAEADGKGTPAGSSGTSP